MSLIKSTPTQKLFRGELVWLSDQVVVSQPQYETQGEGYIVVKDTSYCKLKLNSQTTEHVTIKSLTSTLIIPDVNKIDEEFDEIVLEKGSAIELFNCLGSWYIMSSDGIKTK